MDLRKPCSTMTIELIEYIQNNPDTIVHMDQFLSRYQNAIFNLIHMTVRDYHDSLDITNRVLYTLSKKVKEVERKSAFNALATKIIRGEIGNYLKGQNRKKRQIVKQATIWHNDEEISLFATIASDTPKAEEILNLLVIRDLLENASDPLVKKIFLARYRDDESIEKIAHKLSISDYQVKKYLQQIQDQVKSYLEEKMS